MPDYSYSRALTITGDTHKTHNDTDHKRNHSADDYDYCSNHCNNSAATNIIPTAFFISAIITICMSITNFIPWYTPHCITQKPITVAVVVVPVGCTYEG